MTSVKNKTQPGSKIAPNLTQRHYIWHKRYYNMANIAFFFQPDCTIFFFLLILLILTLLILLRILLGNHVTINNRVLNHFSCLQEKNVLIKEAFLVTLVLMTWWSAHFCSLLLVCTSTQMQLSWLVNWLERYKLLLYMVFCQHTGRPGIYCHTHNKDFCLFSAQMMGSNEYELHSL